MSIREKRRIAVVERMADLLLSEGLAAATLRPMAAAAGTSDRMLLYYFADRNELLTLTLYRISERLLTLLDQAIPVARPWDFAALLTEVSAVLTQDSIRPYMHLWLDLAVGAMRGLEPHRHIAGEIADGFLGWVTVRLKVQVDGQGESPARFLVAIEGLHLLEAIGRPCIAAVARADLIASLRNAG